MSEDHFGGAPLGPKRPPRPYRPRKLTRAGVEEHRQPGAPKPGDSILIRWPGGTRDFEMDFEQLDETMPPAEPGWFWLRGCVGAEYTERFGFVHYDYRTLYARYMEPGVYEMYPRGTSRENGAADPDVAARSGHNR